MSKTFRAWKIEEPLLLPSLSHETDAIPIMRRLLSRLDASAARDECIAGTL
jgi:hypothetical protein